jgi:hypothetical protein
VDRRGGESRRGAAPAPRTVPLLALLIGWLLATGAHWDLVQVAAWGRMWAQFAQVQPLAVALATTFTPEARCSACKAVQAARQHGGDPAVLGADALAKPPLILPSVRTLVIARPGVLEFLTPPSHTIPSPDRAAPPVPPPRADRFAC